MQKNNIVTLGAMCRAYFLVPTQNMLRLLEVAPAQDWLPAMMRFYWNLERPGHYPQTGNRHRALFGYRLCLSR